MKKRFIQKTKIEPPWLAYTDLLSSTLLILSVVVVASVLGKLTNEKPPVIRLRDTADYRFARGSFVVSDSFREKLISEELPKIDKAIQCYAIDTVEVIGHTDNSPNSGRSNLDQYPELIPLNEELNNISTGSNADLGLLRAISVQAILQEEIGDKYEDLQFRAYSASSLINPEYTRSADFNNEKRRIEVRLTRRNKESAITRC